MTTWLIHGFNVSDGGRGSIGKLERFLSGHVVRFSYGWTGLFRLRFTNKQAVRALLRLVKPGDVLIGHSNGALICWEVAEQMGDALGGVVVINPAMRRDTLWAKGVKVLCIYNSKDWVVQLGRAWSRLVSLGGITPHGWGAAGRYGFTHDKKVLHMDSADDHWSFPVAGHSMIFKRPALPYWAKLIRQTVNNWLTWPPEPGG